MDQITPPAPSRPRQLTQEELHERFPVDFSIDETTKTVTVAAAWQLVHLIRIEVIPGHHVTVHRDTASTFAEWLQHARDVGADKCIVTVDGGFNARFKRGLNVPVSEAGLSRHARGIAIDLNAGYNPRGWPPVAVGKMGCLAALVPIAYDLGIVWGGDWHGEYCDPMHFEIGHAAE